MPKPKDKTKTLVILDSHAIIHRAYHALPEFLSSRGVPTGALYGLSNMIMKIISELKPDYIVACYDLKGKTFRHEAYDGYKATRAKTDDTLVAQLIESRKIFEAFNIPIYDSKGYEADDVIGTIVEKLKKDKNTNIIIASGDMDTMQLVEGDKVQVYTLKKGLNDTIMYDEAKVKERFGFPPKLLMDYKGLRGDPSDNIIGVKGIGEKTATSLIQEFGTIENIYKALKKKSAKELGISERILNILKENEEEALFSKDLATIRRNAPIDFQLPAKTFWGNVDPQKIEKLFNELEFRSLISRLKTFFSKSGSEALMQSLDFGESKEKVNEDELNETSIALWVINSDISVPKLEDILSYAQTKSFKEAKDIIFKRLKQDKLEKVYEEIEAPIIPIVSQMTKHGIVVDKEYFQKLSKEYHKELDKITKTIWKLAGQEFNINSPKQLSEILFEKLKLSSGKKRNQSGSFSTKFSVLEELEETHPIIKEILAYRELQKLLSTYIDIIPNLVAEDGRLHARFIQNGSTTGRFSSQDPNMQNLPIKSSLGRRIREGFVASKGHQLAAFDYSQIELRTAAILSHDPKLTEIFEQKKDVHAGVASFVFGVPIDKVDAEMRRKAKVINFGIIYGMGVSALRKNLGGTREEAQRFYDNYFTQFSRVKEYLEEVKEFAEKHKYTETLFGRRRYFPNINSRIPFLKNMAERTATNAPLQGTAADIIKLAIRYADEDLKKAGLLGKAHLVLQIHDELVYEIEDTVIGSATQIITKAMQDVLERSFLHIKTTVPLVVHSGAGANFNDVK